ncbi:signal recognition particle-docking protein FtsY [Stomatohabitans albus]|uniref:signal recognition particle-docking protein FtsY n=1 Tax=Stomatohabitans albus TaxID=3110766 RepID=UPI00300C2164
MLNLNNPTVIGISIVAALLLLLLVWLLTRRTSVVPDAPPSEEPTPPQPATEPVVPSMELGGTIQIGALPEPAPTIDFLDHGRHPDGLVHIEDQPGDGDALASAVVTELPVEPESTQDVASAEVPGAETLVEEEPEAPVEEVAKPSLLQRFTERLTRSRNQLGAQLRSIFGAGLDDESWEDLEDTLISADVGVEATMDLVEQLRTRVREQGITSGDDAMAELKSLLLDDLTIGNREMQRRADGTSVWLFTGVNGTGKTTSIGKLTKRYSDAGDHVVLAAADTFRAAAADQLKIWGERSSVRVIAQAEGADPAAVAFDGWKAAEAAGADILMIDTAGRLQNKTELMAELEKIKRVVERDAGPIDEALLVLDATTGQNGLSQAKAFAEAVNLTGVVLTKLDGTAKGGIVIAIQRSLGIPVKWVGLGEGIEDLAPFEPEAFIDALFAEDTAS